MTDLDVAPHEVTNPGGTRYSLIDVDAHITESPDTWTSRVAERFRERVPHVRRVDGQDVWFIDGQVASPVGPRLLPAGASPLRRCRKPTRICCPRHTTQRPGWRIWTRSASGRNCSIRTSAVSAVSVSCDCTTAN